MKLSQIPKDRYDEVMGHLDSSQGGDLKSLLMEAKRKKEETEAPVEDEAGGSDNPSGITKSPKPLHPEKSSVMNKSEMTGVENVLGVRPKMDTTPDSRDFDPLKKMETDHDQPDHEEMTDDELKELISKYLS